MLVIDDKSPGTAPKPSIFLHGVTGAGKSTWATAGGRPLVILTEPKAMSILRLVNPDAVGLVPQTIQDVIKVFEMLGQADRLAARNIDRIVLDSFTDLTYSLPAWMKDPSGAQILLKMEIQEFGDLKSYAMALVKAIQLTGYPSIIIGRSTVKRVGRVDKVVPDGYGKSVEELPGKCLPTVEARYDSELGYVIDSTPDECSQRCGLPWVPALWQGTALDFIATVAKEAPAKEAPIVQPAKPAPTTAGEVITQLPPPPPTTPSQAASDFVDGVTPIQWCSAEECGEIVDLIRKHMPKLTGHMARYLNAHGHLPDAKNWTRLTKEGHDKLLPCLQTEQGRRGLEAHLLNKFNENAA